MPIRPLPLVGILSLLIVLCIFMAQGYVDSQATTHGVLISTPPPSSPDTPVVKIATRPMVDDAEPETNESPEDQPASE